MTDDEQDSFELEGEGFSEAQSLPHHVGHRDRLRARFQENGSNSVADYELLELILFRSIPRRDIKPIAKELLQRFGSIAEVLSAPVERLVEIQGVGQSVALDLKVVQAAAAVFKRSFVAQESSVFLDATA